jgi:hypothetical protein
MKWNFSIEYYVADWIFDWFNPFLNCLNNLINYFIYDVMLRTFCELQSYDKHSERHKFDNCGKFWSWAGVTVLISSKYSSMLGLRKPKARFCLDYPTCVIRVLYITKRSAFDGNRTHVFIKEDSRFLSAA